jgi:hypothetical protein
MERGDLGAGTASDDLQQPEVVHVLMGDHDQLELLDRVAKLRQSLLQLVERFARVRAGVDQRERLVLDQVAVDAADQERGGNRKLVNCRARSERQRVRRRRRRLVRDSHDLITPSTSSRLRSMSSRERTDSRHSRSSGSVFDGRTLKRQSS